MGYVGEDRRQTVVPTPNNLPYVVAVALMAIVGVVAVTLLVVLRPEKDNGTIIATIVAMIAPTTLSLLAFMKAQETHLSVNSRLDAFMANAKLAAHAEGIAEGRQQGRQSANERTDALADRTDAALAAGSTQAANVPTHTAVVEAPVLVVAPKKEQ